MYPARRNGIGSNFKSQSVPINTTVNLYIAKQLTPLNSNLFLLIHRTIFQSGIWDSALNSNLFLLILLPWLDVEPIFIFFKFQSVPINTTVRIYDGEMITNFKFQSVPINTCHQIIHQSCNIPALNSNLFLLILIEIEEGRSLNFTLNSNLFLLIRLLCRIRKS